MIRGYGVTDFRRTPSCMVEVSIYMRLCNPGTVSQLIHFRLGCLRAKGLSIQGESFPQGAKYLRRKKRVLQRRPAEECRSNRLKMQKGQPETPESFTDGPPMCWHNRCDTRLGAHPCESYSVAG